MRDKSLNESIDYFIFETENKNLSVVQKLNDYRNLLYLISDYALKDNEFKNHLKIPKYERNLIINNYKNNLELKLYNSLLGKKWKERFLITVIIANVIYIIMENIKTFYIIMVYISVMNVLN